MVWSERPGIIIYWALIPVMELEIESRFNPNFSAQILLEIAHEQSLEKLLQKFIDRAMERPHMVCGQVRLIGRG